MEQNRNPKKRDPRKKEDVFHKQFTDLLIQNINKKEKVESEVYHGGLHKWQN